MPYLNILKNQDRNVKSSQAQKLKILGFLSNIQDKAKPKPRLAHPYQQPQLLAFKDFQH